MTFASLGLSAVLLRAVTQLGFAEPTPVQTSAIPAILRGGDVWATAQTGSGKTAAYVLPILESLRASRGPSPRTVRALIVVPTRELAAQVADVIRQCAAHLVGPPKTCVLIGGVSLNPQRMALRGGADIVVATPGRLLDLLAQSALRVSSIETLVLDEADRLFALGFAEELSRLLGQLPARRQNLLFSASFPPAVRALAGELLRDPTRIDVDASATPGPSLIAQRAIEVDVGARTPLLIHLLEAHRWSRVLVFVARRRAADEVAKDLATAGVAAAALHGELSQGTRARTLADFKAKRIQVLVATDVAARGLDIEQLASVVNYDLPRSTVEYAHRIGRTGRAGESGEAISFISASTDAHFRLIAKRYRLTLPRERVAGFEPVDLDVPAQDPTGGVKGKRKSKKDRLREAATKEPPGSA